MWSFNASDVEGSLPGSFPLFNKNTRISSTHVFVIRLMGRVFCRQISQSYLLIHLLAAHILNLSAADCYSQMPFMLAQRTDLLYHSQLPHGKQAIHKVRKHPVSYHGVAQLLEPSSSLTYTIFPS